MQKNIHKKSRLAIISDTGMCLKGGIYIFEPVFREVKNFSHLFGEIIWMGYENKKYKSSDNKLKYNDDDLFIVNYYDKSPTLKRLKKYPRLEMPLNLTLIPVKYSGGSSIFSKILILFYSPYYLINILRIIIRSDIVFTRGPSMPALLAILLSFLFSNKKYWHKYAGNWQIGSKTLTYRLQRWLLIKKIPGTVIISGRNKSDLSHVLSWKNPCLTEQEIGSNTEYGLNKKFDGKLVFCFVGRLEASKGFPMLLDAFVDLDKTDWISKLHCVGEGPEREKYEKVTQKNNTSIIFHGLLDREELNKIYQESHFIIFPSKSEGFPKVLAEASSFGCIPIISPISSITNYINETESNGIVLKNLSSNEIIETIMRLDQDRHHLKNIAVNAINTARGFTYERYNKKIKKQFICD